MDGDEAVAGATEEEPMADGCYGSNTLLQLQTQRSLVSFG